MILLTSRSVGITIILTENNSVSKVGSSGDKEISFQNTLLASFKSITSPDLCKHSDKQPPKNISPPLSARLPMLVMKFGLVQAGKSIVFTVFAGIYNSSMFSRSILKALQTCIWIQNDL